MIFRGNRRSIGIPSNTLIALTRVHLALHGRFMVVLRSTKPRGERRDETGDDGKGERLCKARCEGGGDEVGKERPTLQIGDPLRVERMQ